MNMEPREGHMNMELKALLYRAALALTAASTQMKIVNATTPTEALVLGVKNALQKLSDDVYSVAQIPYVNTCYGHMDAVLRDMRTISGAIDYGLSPGRNEDIDNVREALDEVYALLHDVAHTMSETV